MWLESNCKGIWEMGESKRLFSKTLMSLSQREKMKNMKLEKNQRYLCKSSQHRRLFHCSWTPRRQGSSCKSSPAFQSCWLKKWQVFPESLLNVSQIELLRLLKTFFATFLWKFPSQSTYKSHKEINCSFSFIFGPCTSMLDFWKDFKVRQTGNIGQDKLSKGTNAANAEWDVAVDDRHPKDNKKTLPHLNTLPQSLTCFVCLF